MTLGATSFLSQRLLQWSRDKSLFIRHEADVWDALARQDRAMERANDMLSAKCVEATDLIFCCEDQAADLAQLIP